MNTRRSFIRNLALASVAPAVIAAEPRPVYHNIYKPEQLSRCSITPALAGARGKVFIGDDELALPDACHLDIVFDMWRFHPNGAAGRVVGAGMPMAAIGDTDKFVCAWTCDWILEQCLREQEQAYVPGPLHELVVAQTNLHTAPLWLVHWTPTTFNIEPW